jgi:hypothetical protein
MSAIVILGVEYGANGAIVVLIKAPLILHFLGKWG